MKITRCKLLRKHQLRLLEYFVLEVTARSAADLLEVQPNSAALFYRKLREVITYHLEQKEHEVFDGAVELDESNLCHEGINQPDLFAKGKNPINGIENFWNQAKHVL